MAEQSTLSLLIPVISAVAGGVVTGATAYFLNRTNKKSEEARQLRELLFNAAVENWKRHIDLGIHASGQGKAVTFEPLETYLLGMLKFSEILTNPKVTTEEIRAKSVEVQSLLDAYLATLEKTSA